MQEPLQLCPLVQVSDLWRPAELKPADRKNLVDVTMLSGLISIAGAKKSRAAIPNAEFITEPCICCVVDRLGHLLRRPITPNVQRLDVPVLLFHAAIERARASAKQSKKWLAVPLNDVFRLTPTHASTP